MKHLFPFIKASNTSFTVTEKSGLFIAVLFISSFSINSFAQNPAWFIDVTSQVKLDTFSAGGGIMGIDVNNDDYPDLLSIGSRIHLFLNQDDPNSSKPSDRIFTDISNSSGLNIPPFVEQLCAAADFNNDGNVDVIVSAWYMNMTGGGPCNVNPDDGTNWKTHLLLGDGKGHFTLKANSGLEALGPMSVTALPILDYNRDGNLDIFIGTHYSSWCGFALPNYLMKGNGDGTFTDVSVSSGISSVVNPLFGGNIADWNNDCNQDILTAPYLTSGYGNLWKNNGNNTFTDVAVSAGYNPHFMPGDNGQPMVPWAAMPCDYDNDGDIDLLMLLVHGGNAANEGRSTIFTNQGAANNYSLIPEINRITRKFPVSSHHGDHNGWWLDFDNDGWQDLVIGESGYTSTDRMYFLKQDASHNFIDITTGLGFISGTVIQPKIMEPTQMISMDYDLDGDMDFFKSPYYNNYPFLALRNDVANINHFIKIKLIAPDGVNKSCVGARVTVKAGGIKQQQDIYAGEGSFASQQSPFTFVFGLGNSPTVDSIDVRWPNASCSHSILTNIAVNQFISISKEGLAGVSDINRQRTEFELYPNPSTNLLTIHCPHLTSGEIELKDLTGRSIFRQTVTDKQITVNITSLPSGIYFAVLKEAGGSITVKKWVKE